MEVVADQEHDSVVTRSLHMVDVLVQVVAVMENRVIETNAQVRSN